MHLKICNGAGLKRRFWLWRSATIICWWHCEGSLKYLFLWQKSMSWVPSNTLCLSLWNCYQWLQYLVQTVNHVLSTEDFSNGELKVSRMGVMTVSTCVHYFYILSRGFGFMWIWGCLPTSFELVKGTHPLLIVGLFWPFWNLFNLVDSSCIS